MMFRRRPWRFLLAALLLLASSSASANGPLETARSLFESGAYSQAIQALQAELGKSPQDARLHFWLSRCYYELRDYDRAVQSGESAVRLDTRVSDYWYWLGRAYGEKADREHSLGYARKTKKAFQQAVALDGSNVPARRALIEYLTEAPGFLAGGDKDEAREHIGVLMQQNPVQGQLAWGYYWNEVESPQKAEAAYRRVLELKPKDADAYFEVADFYRKRGDAAQMEAAVESAGRVEPSNPQLNFYRGAARVLAGNRLGEAARYLEAYLAKTPQFSDFPSHASAHEWLGAAYEKAGNRAKAIEHYQTALSLNPRRKGAKEGLKRLGAG